LTDYFRYLELNKLDSGPDHNARADCFGSSGSEIVTARQSLKLRHGGDGSHYRHLAGAPIPTRHRNEGRGLAAQRDFRLRSGSAPFRLSAHGPFPPKKAFVLGAGSGARLRPLSEDVLPKPLIPVINRPLITWAVDALLQGGAKEFIVNTHHLPEAWPQAFPHANWRGHRITFVHEHRSF